MLINRVLKKIAAVPINILIVNLLILVILSAFFVRVYKINDLLGFYYDQGRDALVIWKLWHEGKPFLIGPITGLSGIYLGPLYYYLIAPFYIIGGGDPVYPSVFLAFLSTSAIFVIYKLGREMHSRSAGIIAATITAFSYHIVTAGRWLANPTPILLTSVLLLYAMWKVVDGPLISLGEDPSTTSNLNKWWAAIALLIGVSLQLEAASAVFYIPIVIIFAIWQRRKLPGIKYAIISLGLFLLTLLPQIIFNFRHENILLNNFMKLFFKEKAFRGITVFILEERIKFFWNVFSGKIYAGVGTNNIIFIALSTAALWVNKGNLKKGLLGIFILFLITPILGYTFFQGNFGNIYDYYLSGYFLPFILIFSIGMAEMTKTKFLKIMVIVFFITFFKENITLLNNMFKNPMNGPTDIKFGSQLKAVDWVFNNAAGKGNFNVDVYVPPVIPYAYDYLFLWQGTKICGKNICGKVDYQTPILYLLYEQDPPNPERLDAWLSRYKGSSITIEEARFGGITIQRRNRI